MTETGGPAGPGAFLGQLAPPGFVMDLRGGAQDPASGPPATAPGDGRPVPAVLMLSRAHDSELSEVARLLRKVGVRCLRLNADELASTDLQVDPGRGLIRLDGRWVIPTVTWLRHFSARAIEAAPGPAQVFTRDSWAAMAQSLADISAVRIGSRQPALTTQLRLAARHGVRVPRTCVSTDPAQLAGLFPGQRVVVKVLHRHFAETAPGLLTGVFPVIMPQDELAGQPWPGLPVVVQEYVEHQAELRVYYVAGQLYGFRVGKQAPADPWLNESRVSAQPVELSQAVVTAARELAAAFRLRYGAFDFLVHAGEPVFLEVNVDGDWRWIEHRTGSSPVTGAAARMLHDLHRAQLSAASGGGEPFSLLTFLTG